MERTHAPFLLLVGTLFGVAEAPAQTLTIPFTGRVSSLSLLTQPPPQLTVATGDVVVGVATIQIASANTIVSLPTVSLYSHPTDTMSIATRIGTHLWVTSESGTSSVRNNDPGQGDVMAMSCSTFGGMFFDGADNGLQSLRWEDNTAPFELLAAPWLPLTWGQVDPTQSTTAIGTISGGGWTIEFEISTQPILMTGVDDSSPESPVVRFELTAPASSVSIELGTVVESVGPLPTGSHEVQLNVPRTIAPLRYQVLARATTAAGTFEDSSTFDARWLADSAETSTTPIGRGIIIPPTVTLRGQLSLQRWEWGLPGGIYDRFVREATLVVTSTLPPDKTIPGGSPFIRHVILPTGTVDGTAVQLARVPSIGSTTFWSTSFGSIHGTFARSGTSARFGARGGTISSGGYSPWNLVGAILSVTVPVI